MFKIKLLILSLTSSFLISCAINNQNDNKTKFSINYIGGEFDGLVLKNYVINHLRSLKMYDENSHYAIELSISHSTDLYVTNIDNTSDRENISSTLSSTITNEDKDCNIYGNEFRVSQFYIFAPSSKLLSNQRAIKKIKKNNTELLVKNFINKIKKISLNCNE